MTAQCPNPTFRSGKLNVICIYCPQWDLITWGINGIDPSEPRKQKSMMADVDDEDAPPDLVDVSEIPAEQLPGVEDELATRVPITLVTGILQFDYINNKFR